MRSLFPARHAIWPPKRIHFHAFLLIITMLSATAVLNSLLAPVYTSHAIIRVVTQPELNPPALSIEHSEHCIAAQRSVLLSDVVLQAALVQINKHHTLAHLTTDDLAGKIRFARRPFSSEYLVSIQHSDRESVLVLLQTIVSTYVETIQPYQRAFLAAQHLPNRDQTCRLVFAEVVTGPVPASRHNGIGRGLIAALICSLGVCLLWLYFVTVKTTACLPIPVRQTPLKSVHGQNFCKISSFFYCCCFRFCETVQSNVISGP